MKPFGEIIENLIYLDRNFDTEIQMIKQIRSLRRIDKTGDKSLLKLMLIAVKGASRLYFIFECNLNTSTLKQNVFYDKVNVLNQIVHNSSFRKLNKQNSS